MNRFRRHSLMLVLLIAMALVAAACSGESGTNGTGAAVNGTNGAGETGGGDDTGGDAGGGNQAGTIDPDIPCEDAPRMISTIEELQAIADSIDGGMTHEYVDGHYALSNDIDASDTKNWNGGEGFRPIGTISGPFTGCFDGRGFTIKGLHIDRRETEGIGLFGGTVRSDIRNVTLDGVSVRGGNNTGGLIGETNETDVTNVHVSGTIETSMNGGGLVGDLQGGVVTGSSANVTISASWNDPDVIFRVRSTGGLVGYSTGDIIASTSAGSVSGGDFTGGLVGNTLGDITSSYSTAEVTGVTSTGGLVGRNAGDINNTYSMGPVHVETGGLVAGGLVGMNEFGTISYSFSTGTVTAADDDADNVSGLIGWDRTFERDEPAFKSYWDMDTSGHAESDAGEGRTTAEMQQQATFEDWDFDTIWTIDEGQDYPDLQAAPR